MSKCGCFDGFRKVGQGCQRPRALPAPLEEVQDAVDPHSPSKGSTASPSSHHSAPSSPQAACSTPTSGRSSGRKPSLLQRVMSWSSESSRAAADPVELPAAALELDTAGVQRVNGFRTKPEIEVIRVSERNIPLFALPLEALTYEPPRDQTFVIFPNGDSERMIHCNTGISDEECEQLTELRVRAERAGLAFSPSVSIAATRFICDARGDVPLALEKMCKSQAWRENFFRDGPITDEEVAEDLAHGVVYFGGRDFAMRPTFFCRPSRAPDHFRRPEGTKRLTRLLIFCLEYFLRYLAAPGKVENFCVCVDLKDSGYMPISMLRELAGVMSQQHAARVWRFYICNMSWLLNVMSKLVQAAMTDRQVEKIKFLEDNSVLRKDFALHQLEKDFGGTLPTTKTFFPFPMQPGPFERGCSTGPDKNAVKEVQKVLTPEGVRGRLWDPVLSLEENTRLEFSDDASAFFRRCDVPISPQLLEAVNIKHPKVHRELKNVAPTRNLLLLEEPGASRDGSVKDDSTTPGDSTSPPEEDVVLVPSPEITTQEVCPSQVFSCMLFKCTVGVSKRVKKE